MYTYWINFVIFTTVALISHCLIVRESWLLILWGWQKDWHDFNNFYVSTCASICLHFSPMWFVSCSSVLWVSVFINKGKLLRIYQIQICCACQVLHLFKRRWSSVEVRQFNVKDFWWKITWGFTLEWMIKHHTDVFTFYWLWNFTETKNIQNFKLN